jgi:hypothetical protein
MIKYITLIIISIIVLSCSNKSKITGDFKLTLYESYSSAEIFFKINESNSIIRKIELDSLANQKTGNSLIDVINEQKIESESLDENSRENFPLFEVFAPITKTGNNGQRYVDTSSAMIGTTNDTATLLKYLSITDSLFPTDLKWKISGKLRGNNKAVYAVKNSPLQIRKSDVDSVLVFPAGLNVFGGLVAEVADQEGISEYVINIKLSEKLKLKNHLYSLFLTISEHEYSTSIINYKNNSNQYITIENLDKDDIDVLVNILGDKVEIKK